MSRDLLPSLSLAVVAYLFVIPLYGAGQSAAAPSEQFGPLHDRAARNGGHLVEATTDQPQVFVSNMRELAARADTVVIGRVLALRGHLATDRDHVQTDVALQIREVVRGTSRPADVIFVSFPGGAFRFDDGVLAVQYVPGYHQVRKQHTYLLFLRKAPQGLIPGKIAFQPAVPLTGQFELDRESMTVVPSRAHGRDAMWRRYRSLPLADFLTELHRVLPPGQQPW